MWSDNEAAIDLLGFQHLKTSVLSIVKDDSLLPATIGVFGDWGSGKSSLIRMVSEDLSAPENEGVLVVSFNGWLFESYDDAKTAIMGSIVDAIVSRRTVGTQVKETAKRLGLKILKKIQLFNLLGLGTKTAFAYAVGGSTMATTVAATEGSAYIASQLNSACEAIKNVQNMDIETLEKSLANETNNNLRQNIRDFMKEFESLLAETNIKTLVVIIDDLDRCMPDTIIETLEAIKLFLFVPRTAFIIGADERLVRYAVRRRFPELPGEKTEVGQDYLEKLIQYPIRVPPLGHAEIETYINLLYTEKAKIGSKYFEAARKQAVECSPDALLEVRYNQGIAQRIMGKDFPPELGEDLCIAQQIAPVLAAGLTGNPRQCKRFLNTLVMRSEMAKSRGIDLKPSVLAKLMLLERFHTQSYKLLAKSQAAQAGKPTELVAAEEKFKQPTERKHARDKIKAPDGEESQSTSPEITSEWLSDPALEYWIKSEPPLSGENLQPYFYFSRDTLGPMSSAIQRMTPEAQELLTVLFKPGKAQRMLCLKQAKELGSGDASAVFQAIGERLKTESDLGQEDSALWRMIDWVSVRKELLGQMVALLSDLHEAKLPLSLPPRIAQLAKTPEEKATTKKMLEKWSRSTVSPGLGGAATSTLKRA